jgi:hypothetical protein
MSDILDWLANYSIGGWTFVVFWLLIVLFLRKLISISVKRALVRGIEIRTISLVFAAICTPFTLWALKVLTISPRVWWEILIILSLALSPVFVYISVYMQQNNSKDTISKDLSIRQKVVLDNLYVDLLLVGGVAISTFTLIK